MSIKNKQQITIHLKNFRNLSNYTIGRYLARVSIYTKINNKTYYAVPINVIEKNPSLSNSDNESLTDDCYYMTKTFALKGGSNADIDQICIFRFDVQIGVDQQDYTQIQSYVVVQLIHNEYAKLKIVGQYVGKTKGVISDALVMDFYESCPGQLIGSVHTCIVTYQCIKGYKPESKIVEKQTQQLFTQVLKYLDEMSQRNYKKILQNLAQLKCEKISQLQLQKKQDNFKVNKQNFFSQEQIEEKTQCTQRHSLEQCLQKVKRKRKPIFENSLPAQKKPIGLKKSLKVPHFEKNIHQNSMKIYQIWRQLNELLFKKQGDQFILIKSKQYDTKLRNKVGQSVIRFKGLKDIDEYSDMEQIQRRNMMVSQLRNQHNQIMALTNQFSILNEKYFTKERPIFFQENVQVSKIKQEPEKPLDFMLVFLVHGLGACRLDMQKLKIQLKRYYQDKVKIYVSTSNQSRTQGDIDGMGLRLASQVQSQVLKSKGSFKITMIGHSMGGLIIRSALPKLQKIKDKFHSFISFSSPHIGYAYSASKLVDAGLWIMNTMKKCVSIEQMTMIDKPKIEDCFLYKLSQQKGLEWFKKVTFLASHQDSYVPFYSARIQKSKQIQTDYKKGFSRSVSYCQMIDNVLNRINGDIKRLDVNFCIPQQNIDNLIGRAAHISFINNVEMLRAFCMAQEGSIF